MTIYHDLAAINAKIAPQHKKLHLRRSHNDLYSTILDKYPVTERTSFPEIFYIVSANLKEKPKCHCGKNVKWSHHNNRYNSFCSQRCSVHVANEAARSPLAKQKRKSTVLERYGVENVSHCDEIKGRLSKIRSSYWAEARTSDTVDGSTLDEYQRRVHQRSNTEYMHHIDKIDPNRLRGKDFHLDHVYSKFDGFNNSVPVEVISHWSNLRIISAKENLSKNRHSDKTLFQLYEDYSSRV